MEYLGNNIIKFKTSLNYNNVYKRTICNMLTYLNIIINDESILLVYVKDCDNTMKYANSVGILGYLEDHHKYIVSIFIIKIDEITEIENFYDDYNYVKICLQTMFTKIKDLNYNIYVKCKVDSPIQNIIEVAEYSVVSVNIINNIVHVKYISQENNSNNYHTIKGLHYAKEIEQGSYIYKINVSDNLINEIKTSIQNMASIIEDNILIIDGYLDNNSVVCIINTIRCIKFDSMHTIIKPAPFIFIIDNNNYMLQIVFLMIKYYDRICGVFHLNKDTLRFYQLNKAFKFMILHSDTSEYLNYDNLNNIILNGLIENMHPETKDNHYLYHCASSCLNNDNLLNITDIISNCEIIIDTTATDVEDYSIKILQ